MTQSPCHPQTTPGGFGHAWPALLALTQANRDAAAALLLAMQTYGGPTGHDMQSDEFHRWCTGAHDAAEVASQTAVALKLPTTQHTMLAGMSPPTTPRCRPSVAAVAGAVKLNTPPKAKAVAVAAAVPWLTKAEAKITAVPDLHHAAPDAEDMTPLSATAEAPVLHSLGEQTVSTASPTSDSDSQPDSQDNFVPVSPGHRNRCAVLGDDAQPVPAPTGGAWALATAAPMLDSLGEQGEVLSRVDVALCLPTHGPAHSCDTARPPGHSPRPPEDSS